MNKKLNKNDIIDHCKDLCNLTESLMADDLAVSPKHIHNLCDKLGVNIQNTVAPNQRDSSSQDKDFWMQFKKCDACQKKTGASLLCFGCVHNREVISKLEWALEKNSIQLPSAENYIFDK